MNKEVYNNWLEANEEDLLDQWESIGEVEQWEMGEDFETFCETQYQESL
jgi:hypothetical protein